MQENYYREVNGNELSSRVTQNGREILRYEIIYPRIKATTPVEGRINRYHQTAAKDFERLIKSRYLPAARQQFKALEPYGAFEPTEISASFQVMHSSHGLLSMFTDTYFRLQHSGYKMARSSKTYDMQSGAPLLLPNIFKPRCLFRQEINRQLAQLIEEESGKNPGCYFSDWQQLYGGKISDSAFYIADDGIVIYFQPETIANMNAGIPSFMVPFATFEGCLRFGL